MNIYILHSCNCVKVPKLCALHHRLAPLSSRGWTFGSPMEAAAGSPSPHPPLMETNNGLPYMRASSSIDGGFGSTTRSTTSTSSSAFGTVEEENVLHPVSQNEARVSSSDGDSAVRRCHYYCTTSQAGLSAVLAEDEAVAEAQADESDGESTNDSAKRQRHELTPEVKEEIKHLKEVLFSSTASTLYACEKAPVPSISSPNSPRATSHLRKRKHIGRSHRTYSRFRKKAAWNGVWIERC